MRIRLDIPLKIREVEKSIGVPIKAVDETVSHVTTDSRLAERGDLFFALNRANDTSNGFISEALSRGATVISECDGLGCISVKSSVRALGDLAAYYKSRLEGLKSTVMITGSVGKSTTKEFCKEILSRKYTVHSNEGNLNNLIGLPISILKAKRNTEILVLEAGMNALGEISRLSRIARPDIGIITNVGTAHIGMLGGRQMIARAKLEILDGMEGGRLLVPEDEPLLSHTDSLKVEFSGREQDYSLIAKEALPHYTDFSFFRRGVHMLDGRLNIGGKHLTRALAFALSVGDRLGLSLEELAEGVNNIKESSTRTRLVKIRNFTVLDDSYNSSAESVIAALEELSLFKDRKRSALLGDMLELGDFSECEHERIGEAAAKSRLSALFAYGEFAEVIKRGAIRGGMSSEKIFINTDASSPRLTAEQIINNVSDGEIILFKASHALKLSKICDLLKEMTEKQKN